MKADESAGEDETESDDRSQNRTRVSNRKEQLLKHAESIGAAGHLVVAEAPHTLEADLLGPENNEPVLKDALPLSSTVSLSTTGKTFAGTGKGRSFGFYQKLCKYDKFISKGEFAHDVALAIEDGKAFEAPEYLAKAIRGALESGTDGTKA
ncbi:hypothetical protein SALBM311S_01823 [Streptomyces alboniger]